MTGFLKRIKSDIGYNLKAVLVFEVLHRLLAIVLIWELFNRGMNIALKFSGYSYLTGGNLFSFIIKPATIVFILMLFTACSIIQLFEVSILLTAFKASAARCKLKLSELVFLGLRNIKPILRIGNISAVFPVMIFSTALNIWFLWRLIVHIRPIDYYFQQVDDKQVFIYAGIILLFLLYILLSCTVYQLMYLIFDRSRMKINRSRGFEFFKKKAFRTIISVFFINLTAGILYYLLNKLFVSAFILVVSIFNSKRNHLALILTVSDYSDLIASAIAAVFGTVFTLGICVSMFFGGKGEQFKWESSVYLYWIPERFRRAVKIISAVMILLLLGVYSYNAIYNGTIRADSSLFHVQITSHRGSSLQAPENTIPAIELAIENLSDYIEIDIQMTKDGEMVLLHDKTLRRTAGVDKKLQDMTYEEVKRLDAGQWFGDEFKGACIPSLAEVMDIVKGKANLNIEMKRNSSGGDMAAALVEMIEEYDMEKQCVVTSTDHDYLEQVKELNPDIRTGYIITAAYGNYFDDDSVDFFSVCSSYLNANSVKAAHKYGKEIYAWTVNSVRELERMKNINVDNIITDNPVLARTIIYQ